VTLEVLLVRGARTDLALKASEVARVVPAAEWAGGGAVEVQRALALPLEDGAEVNVLELHGAPPVLARGKLSTVSLPDEQVLALPACFSAGLVWAVVLAEERHPVMIVEAAGVAALPQEAP